MLGIGMQEILIIMIAATVLFGAKRLPDVGRALGEGIREFKKAGREIQSDIEEVTRDPKEE